MPFDLAELIELPSLLVAQKQLFSEKCQDDPAFVSVLFNEFDTEEDVPFFSGFEPDETIIAGQNLFNNLKKIGGYLLEEYEKKGRHKWSHADQRRVLEKAIRIFDKAEKARESDNGISENVNLKLGKAFLYRARIIKPKGLTVPAKKIEAINKALDYCQKAGDDSAAHLKGLIALERERCDIDLTDDEIAWLEKATKAIDPLDKYKDNIERQIEFYQMRVRLEESNGSNYDSDVIKKIFNLEDKKDFKNNGLELEKLKVAMHNSSVSNVMKSACLKNLYNRLKETPFSHPLWGDTVRYLKRLFCQHGNKRWEKLAIGLWTVAEHVVHQTTSPHLRWYWSRQRDLYDMAFLAALDPENNKEKQDQKKIQLAAQIADSAKNRPALTWQAIERMITQDADIDEEIKDKLKKEIKNYAQVLAGGYIRFERGNKNRGEIDYRNQIDQEEEHKIDKVFENISNNQIIVQFYLVHLSGNEKGYALVYEYDGKTKHWSMSHTDKDGKVIEYSFDFQEIWKKYAQWQSVYLDLPSRQRDPSADQLKELCLSLGEELAFLFNLGKNQDKPRNLLFIPHDFLHRVPIHGAMLDKNGDAEIILKNFDCAYLPTASYAVRKPKATKNRSVLLQYFDETEQAGEELASLFDDIKFFNNNRNKSASANDLLKIAKDPPSMLTVYCHGQADSTNPFFSKLLLKTDLKLITLAGITDSFKGTHIFLSACETDLIPPLDSPLDEQISMAAMFLNKGAQSVLGTMWEAYADNVKELLSDYKPNQFDYLFKWQKKQWEDFSDLTEQEQSYTLYSSLCFKLYHC